MRGQLAIPDERRAHQTQTPLPGGSIGMKH
jgi:hypothetical protein